MKAGRLLRSTKKSPCTKWIGKKRTLKDANIKSRKSERFKKKEKMSK